MPKNSPSHTPENCPVNDRVNEHYSFIKEMLVKIDSRLDTLNGKVASHERNWGGQTVINNRVEELAKGLSENDKLTAGLSGKVIGLSAGISVIVGVVSLLLK